jgi:hypothetical protein
MRSRIRLFYFETRVRQARDHPVGSIAGGNPHIPRNFAWTTLKRRHGAIFRALPG